MTPTPAALAAVTAFRMFSELPEVVMATNPTLEGDGTALYLSNLLDNLNVQVTRLARGIASGSVLEFANREMLADAMRGRQSF